MSSYGMEIRLKGRMNEVKAIVVEALKDQGFGILTEHETRNALAGLPQEAKSRLQAALSAMMLK